MATNNTNEISLRENNPYSVGNIFLFDEGDLILDREPIVPAKSSRDRYYTVEQEDSFGLIAFKAYGDSKWWWIIRDANKIDYAFDLVRGTTLLIPDLNTVKVSSL
jgi:hypothetical protein